MLQVIYGPDTFTAHEKLREILSSHVGQGEEPGNVQWIEGKTATPSQILEACGQVSMFTTTKVVVVEGLLGRFSKGDGRKKPPKGKKRAPRTDDLGEWQTFSERVRLLPESSVLILLDAEVKGANTLLSALSLQPEEVTLCPSFDQNKLVRWVQERAAARGGRIEGPAASRLAALVGSDLWLLNSEVEKLLVYADGAPVQTVMVDNMAASATTPSIFMLVDAIVERNVQAARRRLDDMYSKGLSTGYVFTMVARQLRLIAQVHEMRQHRGAQPSGELAALQPFALQRATQQAQRLSEAATRSALQHVVDADRAIKTGVYTDRMALDMLITDIVGSAA